LSIALSLAMAAAQLALYPQVLNMPGGAMAALEPAVLLLLYIPLVTWATGDRSPQRLAALQIGAGIGLACGGLEIVHIAVETFASLGARAETISTGAFMLGLLLLWATAGFMAVRRRPASGPGWLAGGWSAMVGMLMVVTYGFSQLYWALPRLEQKNVGSPDLLRSGWNDLHAFAIADLFEAAFKVLLTGPVLGAVLGAVGGLAASLLIAHSRALASRDSRL
jgi:hypothetical protein